MTAGGVEQNIGNVFFWGGGGVVKDAAMIEQIIQLYRYFQAETLTYTLSLATALKRLHNSQNSDPFAFFINSIYLYFYFEYLSTINIRKLLLLKQYSHR